MEKSALICAINSRQISRVFYFAVQHSISIIQAVLKRQVCITFYRGATDKRQLESKLVQLSTGLRQTRSFVGGNLCNFPPPGDRLNTPKLQGCTIFRQLLIGPIGFSSSCVALLGSVTKNSAFSTFLYSFLYLTSVPPHSTTVKPSLWNASNF